MKNLYTEKCVVDATSLDMRMNMSIIEILRAIEANAFNHAKLLGLDHQNMIDKCNAFWIVSKIKMKIVNPNIRECDHLKISTWTHQPGVLRFDRDSAIKKGNRLMVKTRSEWCCLDATTRRPRKASSVYYPDLEMVEDKDNNLTYTNLKLDVTVEDYVYTKHIRSTDLDINNHTNNLKYNYIALDAFSSKELYSFDIKEYEIYFVNESHEGDAIDVYKRKYKNYYYIEGKTQDKTIFRVVLKVK